MENKLTLESIQSYLAHGLNLIIEKSGKVFQMHSCYDNGVLNIKGEAKGQNYDMDTWPSIKPILRKMDLTKPITVEGKEIIPLIELANISFPNNEVYGKWKLFKNKDVAYCDGFTFTYTEGGFYAESRYSEDAVFVPSQKCLFKWLYKHKFDVDGLCEKGLAIDADSLPTNPYNN